MILPALQTQDLILRLPSLALGGLQVVTGHGKLSLQGVLGTFGRHQRSIQTHGLFPQLLQFRRTAQHARVPGRRAAGHGAAAIYHLPVQSHNPEAIATPPGQGDTAVQVLHNHCTPQKIAENIPILFRMPHQTGGQPYKARLVLHIPQAHFRAPDSRQRQEGGTARAALFQEVDGSFGVLFPVHHDILQARAQRRLNGQRVFGTGTHQVCHRPVNMTAPRLTDQLDGLGIALIFPLHLLQHPDTALQIAHVHGQPHAFLDGFLRFPLPFLHPQAVTGYDVGRLLCLLQGFLILPRRLPGVCKLVPGGTGFLRGGLLTFH